ncbi:hypothetical protein [Clavibacter michiganensis]|uniref:hypothetical protein n=1 Tax=Clavibacter michiganensis TaxID=28447 RepID=UPI00155453C0|nr:hypothetical protein [Clavibacter michiganensis]
MDPFSWSGRWGLRVGGAGDLALEVGEAPGEGDELAVGAGVVVEEQGADPGRVLAERGGGRGDDVVDGGEAAERERRGDPVDGADAQRVEGVAARIRPLVEPGAALRGLVGAHHDGQPLDHERAEAAAAPHGGGDRGGAQQQDRRGHPPGRQLAEGGRRVGRGVVGRRRVPDEPWPLAEHA